MVSPALHPALGRTDSAGRRGFTLVEVLVAILISSLVMLMVVSTLDSTLRVTAGSVAGEIGGRRDDRVRALANAQLNWIELNESKQPRRFRGLGTGLEFRTLVPSAAPHVREPLTVKWIVLTDPQGGAVLVYDESFAPPEEQPGDAGANPGGSGASNELPFRVGPSARTVSDAFDAISVSYLVLEPGGGHEWLPDWPYQDTLPRAVRFTFHRANQELAWVLPVVVTF